jgi:hypothetical protein
MVIFTHNSRVTVSVPLLVGFDPSSKKPAPMGDALISKPPGVAVEKVTNQIWDGHPDIYLLTPNPFRTMIKMR